MFEFLSDTSRAHYRKNCSVALMAMYFSTWRVSLNHLYSCYVCKLWSTSLQSSILQLNLLTRMWSLYITIITELSLHVLRPPCTYVWELILFRYHCTEVHSHSTAHWTGRFYCLIPVVCILHHRCRLLHWCRVYWRDCVDHLWEYQDHHSQCLKMQIKYGTEINWHYDIILCTHTPKWGYH